VSGIRIHRHRKTDPITSAQGAHDVAQRAPSQMMRLLLTYQDARSGRTDDEAAQEANLLHTGYWKRCSELRTNGWIAPVKIAGMAFTRRSRAGSSAQVCLITDEGRAELSRRGLGG
jgi:hypothetical protein